MIRWSYSGIGSCYEDLHRKAGFSFLSMSIKGKGSRLHTQGEIFILKTKT